MYAMIGKKVKRKMLIELLNKLFDEKVEY